MDYLQEKSNEALTEIRAMYLVNPGAVSYYESNNGTLYDYLADADAKNIIGYIMDNAMEEFPKIDKQNYNVVKFSPALEKMDANTVAYYHTPTLDDPDGNLIRVNGKYTDDYWPTLAHEGCPGHMYQRNYYMSTDPELFRLIVGDLGYTEGWAVYSQRLTMKYCDYNGNQYKDELAKLDNLFGAFNYALYGIIDIGINEKGWTLEDVKKYISSQNLNEDIAEKMYIYLSGDPGAYLSYSIGYFEMQDMRDYAEYQLGSKFNVVEYHKVVLETGPCPFSMLKKRVDKYILENK